MATFNDTTWLLLLVPQEQRILSAIPNGKANLAQVITTWIDSERLRLNQLITGTRYHKYDNATAVDKTTVDGLYRQIDTVLGTR